MKRKMKGIVVGLLAFILMLPCAMADDVLSNGSKGDAVTELQQMLINQGYLEGKADGVFGRKTETAVFAFQKANGLPETGTADDTTLSAIDRREEDRQANLVLTNGSTGYDVSQLQERLIQLGYLSGAATGKFDAMTEAALIVFQARHGLSPSGSADKTVRDVLYSESAMPKDKSENSVESLKPEANTEQEILVDPDETTIIERLGFVADVGVIAPVTEDNDPNGKLHKPGGYTAMVYFSSPLVSSDAERKTPDQVIKEGTDGGGSVEVYVSEADALMRDEYLAAFDGTVFDSGAHKVVGTCIIRISSRLNATEQQNLQDAVIQALMTGIEVPSQMALGNEAAVIPTNGSEPDDSVSIDAEPEDAIQVKRDNGEALFSVPIGNAYQIGSEIDAGMYFIRPAGGMASVTIHKANGIDCINLWSEEETARLILSEGDSIDIQLSEINFYPGMAFSYESPEDISVPRGNRYVIGKDIPAGTYSGFAEGPYGTVFNTIISQEGAFLNAVSLDAGERMGKIVLEEGNELTVQYGTLHLVPYAGIAGQASTKVPTTPTDVPTATPFSEPISAQGDSDTYALWDSIERQYSSEEVTSVDSETTENETTVFHLYDNAEVMDIPTGGSYSLIYALKSDVTMEALVDWYYNYVEKNEYKWCMILYSDSLTNEGVYANAGFVEVGDVFARDEKSWGVQDSSKAKMYIAINDGLQEVE